MRKTVNNRLKYEENRGKKMQLSKCNTNPNKSWKKMKSIFNWHSSGSPSKLFFNGQLFIKSQEIADTQNKCFVDKVRKLRDENSFSVSDPLTKLKSHMTGR